MSALKEHRFFLTFRVGNELVNGFFSGINLRHAKEKLLHQYMDASDIMDWTHERVDDLYKYVKKHSFQPQFKSQKMT
jgi:elongation factor P--beta-lysine ligase